MRVYIALTDGKNYLIVQKRVNNSWWGHKHKSQPQAVNAGGYWVLPGGKHEATNTQLTALNEFKEESGVDLARIGYKIQWDTPTSNEKYVVERATVSTGDLNAIREQALQNTTTKHTVSPDESVKDWEWDTPTLVLKAKLGEYLGNPQKHKPNAPDPEGPHSIDWYAAIATVLSGKTQ
jgi:8-oxo-dGTP pyrophosphatase MutT (NUDIX family)